MAFGLRRAWCGVLVMCLACGPEADGEDAGGGSGGADGLEPEPSDLDGFTIESVNHGYQCIDGCESHYSSHDLDFVITAEQDVEIDVQWHDWTLGDRALTSSEPPIAETTIALPAGVPVSVDLRESQSGFCSMDVWTEPVRVLLTIDGQPVEVTGHSGGGGGYDC